VIKIKVFNAVKEVDKLLENDNNLDRQVKKLLEVSTNLPCLKCWLLKITILNQLRKPVKIEEPI